MKAHKLDIEKNLQKNTKINVCSLGEEGSYYDSRIEDIDSNYVYISMPTQKGRPISVRKGSVLTVTIQERQGRVTFDTKVENVVKEPQYMLVLTLPETLRHEQMRQFFRIPVRIKGYIWHGKIDAVPAHRHLFEEVQVTDLSGGGCRFNTHTKMIEGDSVIVDISESVPEVSLIPSKVVRVESISTDKASISVNFEEINENMRDKIVRYVFRRQMELRSKL